MTRTFTRALTLTFTRIGTFTFTLTFTQVCAQVDEATVRHIVELASESHAPRFLRVLRRRVPLMSIDEG